MEAGTFATIKSPTGEPQSLEFGAKADSATRIGPPKSLGFPRAIP